MKFEVRTTNSHYTVEDADKLKKIGFSFSRSEYMDIHRCKANQIKANDSVFVEISTLDELLAFRKEWGDIVIHDDYIEIYDGYRE